MQYFDLMKKACDSVGLMKTNIKNLCFTKIY